jgi:hypothetical protein
MKLSEQDIPVAYQRRSFSVEIAGPIFASDQRSGSAIEWGDESEETVKGSSASRRGDEDGVRGEGSGFSG